MKSHRLCCASIAICGLLVGGCSSPTPARPTWSDARTVKSAAGVDQSKTAEARVLDLGPAGSAEAVAALEKELGVRFSRAYGTEAVMGDGKIVSGPEAARLVSVLTQQGGRANPELSLRVAAGGPSGSIGRQGRDWRARAFLAVDAGEPASTLFARFAYQSWKLRADFPHPAPTNAQLEWRLGEGQTGVAGFRGRPRDDSEHLMLVVVSRGADAPVRITDAR